MLQVVVSDACSPMLWEQEVAGSNPAAPISIKSKPRSDGAEVYHCGTLLCFRVPWVPPDGLGNPCGHVYFASLSTLQRHRWPITDPLRSCARPKTRPPDRRQRWMHFVLEVASYDRFSPAITRLMVQCDSWNAPSVAKKWRVLRRCAHDVRAFSATGPLPEEVASPYRSQC